MSSPLSPQKLLELDFHPTTGDDRAEILSGLKQKPPTLSPRFFYDKTGSRLFEEICALPEYYPTRTEIAILRANRELLSLWTGRENIIIEYGSGNSEKIEILLREMPDLYCYTAIDISREILYESNRRVAANFPVRHTVSVCANYLEPIDFSFFSRELADFQGVERRKIIFFPGSTIGNFSPIQRREFLALLWSELSPGDGVIIGLDLVKDPKVLEAAYNDARGVTARFNLNILRHLNRRFGTGFPLDNFDHRAIYNQAKQRVEMHLVARKDFELNWENQNFAFQSGDYIHTENSYKFEPESARAQFAEFGFSTEHLLTDDQGYFCVAVLRREQE